MKKRKFDPNDFEFSIDPEGSEFLKSWRELRESEEFQECLKEIVAEEGWTTLNELLAEEIKDKEFVEAFRKETEAIAEKNHVL